jgi:ElaB/YqjD/DUF883 family membrane-anchored ribosome-binding protein
VTDPFDDPRLDPDDLGDRTGLVGHDDLADLDAEGIVRRVMDVVVTAKSMPLSASVLVSRDEVIGLLAEALDRLPDELRQARWLLREREEFLAEKAREAEALMEEVRVQAERMVSRTEVVRQANQVAQRILDDANEESRRMRHEAEDYCDQKLAGMEIVLDRIMRTVQAGREKLQATAPATAAADAPGAVAGLGGDEGDDGFFDQDLS